MGVWQVERASENGADGGEEWNPVHRSNCQSCLSSAIRLRRTLSPNGESAVDSMVWGRQCVTAEGTIPKTFDKAMVTTVEECVAAADRIGFPVMLKASEGGGGKGIRMSANKEELISNFDQVKAEVPGSPMFMMQLCTEARHLEVQIVGDEHGNAVAFNGRDCSTQRRFQKIFEEGPPIVAKPDIFREMEKAAQRLTQNIGYIGAGTVEYISRPKYSPELNPRLQLNMMTEGMRASTCPHTAVAGAWVSRFTECQT